MICSFALKCSEIYLVSLFTELYRLQLRILDLSGNKLIVVPHQYQLMNTLEELRLEDNPLNSPPANVSHSRLTLCRYPGFRRGSELFGKLSHLL